MVALSLLLWLHPSSTVTALGSGASLGDLASTRIWKLRFLYGLRSTPAVSGYHPNRFQPIPMNPGPSPCSLRPVLPLTPLPESGPTFDSQLGFLSHDSQPCAPAPAPSPSQMTSELPLGAGTDAVGAAFMAIPPGVA